MFISQLLLISHHHCAHRHSILKPLSAQFWNFKRWARLSKVYARTKAHRCEVLGVASYRMRAHQPSVPHSYKAEGPKAKALLKRNLKAFHTALLSILLLLLGTRLFPPQIIGPAVQIQHWVSSGVIHTSFTATWIMLQIHQNCWVFGGGLFILMEGDISRWWYRSGIQGAQVLSKQVSKRNGLLVNFICSQQSQQCKLLAPVVCLTADCKTEYFCFS